MRFADAVFPDEYVQAFGEAEISLGEGSEIGQLEGSEHMSHSPDGGGARPAMFSVGHGGHATTSKVNRNTRVVREEVAFVPGPADSRATTRELFYTAVTRARSRAIVCGDAASVVHAVGRATERVGGLDIRLSLPSPDSSALVPGRS